MSEGRYHYSLTLPGGQRVTADYREPVTMVMRRVAAAWSDRADPESSDLAEILAFYERNIQAVTMCQTGRCDHDC